jgi:SAM-dependent methyltransferase
MANMGDVEWNAPDHARDLLSRGIAGPRYLGAALHAIAPRARDAWWDRFLFADSTVADSIPEDEAELPPGCAPYLPCPIEHVLTALGALEVRADDVFVDVGSGLGRVTSLVHLLTGAAAIGIEVQPHLVDQAKRLALPLKRPRLVTVRGDASQVIRYLPIGTAYFLYCPFGGGRLATTLRELEQIARTRRIRIACVDMPPLELT